jgi:hypothetical protein
LGLGVIVRRRRLHTWSVPPSKLFLVLQTLGVDHCVSLTCLSLTRIGLTVRGRGSMTAVEHADLSGNSRYVAIGRRAGVGHKAGTGRLAGVQVRACTCVVRPKHAFIAATQTLAMPERGPSRAAFKPGGCADNTFFFLCSQSHRYQRIGSMLGGLRSATAAPNPLNRAGAVKTLVDDLSGGRADARGLPAARNGRIGTESGYCP